MKLSEEAMVTDNGEPGLALVISDDRIVVRGTGTTIARLTDAECEGLLLWLEDRARRKQKK